MKKKIIKLLWMMSVVVVLLPTTVLAAPLYQGKDELISISSPEFEVLIIEIQTIKKNHPEYTESMILEEMNERHPEVRNSKGIGDIWNALTDSEKNYVFDILLML